MLVLTVMNFRRKMFNVLKYCIIFLALFSTIVFIFESFPEKISLKAWQTNKDHPGRVLRVENEEFSGISKVFAFFK